MPNNVLVIGESCLDITKHGIAKLNKEDKSIPCYLEISASSAHGMGGNVSRGLSKLGIATTFLSNSSSDLIRTRYYDSGNKYLYRHDIDKQITPLTSSEALANITSDVEAIVIVDYGKGFLTTRVISDIMLEASAMRINVFVDTKRTDLSIFTGAIVKINSDEALRVLSSFGVHSLITTHGSEGCITTTPKTGGTVAYKIPNNMQFPAVNVSGAGDAFMVGLVYGFLRGNFKYTIEEYANVIASYKVGIDTFDVPKSDIIPSLMEYAYGRGN